MSVFRVSMPLRTLLGGAICLAILGGMMVGHAWPLWTGETVLLRVRPVDPRDLFRGEYVRLDTPATQLYIVSENVPAPATAVPVRGLDVDQGSLQRGRIVYVQLERAASGEHEPVTISAKPVADATNLRGRVRTSNVYSTAYGPVYVDYGLDAFYMQEGTAQPVEHALRAGKRVQMEVAVASSGRARIRTLLVDGVSVR